MSEIVIVQMTQDELREEFRQLMYEASKLPHTDVAMRRLVNRDFLKRNYGWSKHKVNNLIASGALIRQLTENAKTDYFLLSDCEAIYAAEIKR